MQPPVWSSQSGDAMQSHTVTDLMYRHVVCALLHIASMHGRNPFKGHASTVCILAGTITIGASLDEPVSPSYRADWHQTCADRCELNTHTERGREREWTAYLSRRKWRWESCIVALILLLFAEFLLSLDPRPRGHTAWDGAQPTASLTCAWTHTHLDMHTHMQMSAHTCPLLHQPSQDIPNYYELNILSPKCISLKVRVQSSLCQDHAIWMLQFTKWLSPSMDLLSSPTFDPNLANCCSHTSPLFIASE